MFWLGCFNKIAVDNSSDSNLYFSISKKWKYIEHVVPKVSRELSTYCIHTTANKLEKREKDALPHNFDSSQQHNESYSLLLSHNQYPCGSHFYPTSKMSSYSISTTTHKMLSSPSPTTFSTNKPQHSLIHNTTPSHLSNPIHYLTKISIKKEKKYSNLLGVGVY
jgi:hypothetical protein